MSLNLKTCKSINLQTIYIYDSDLIEDPKSSVHVLRGSGAYAKRALVFDEFYVFFT